MTLDRHYEILKTKSEPSFIISPTIGAFAQYYLRARFPFL